MPSQKLITGVNDLQTLFPTIAAEADGWDPSKVHPGGNRQKRRWKCTEGHFYEKTPYSRTHHSTGCPICNGELLLTGTNDLGTLFPSLSKSLDGLEGKYILPKSTTKIGWICPKGHQYQCSPSDRTKKNVGCPYCAGKKVLIGFNDFKSQNTKISEEAYEWDPETLTFGSNKKVKWKCPEGHIYETSPKERSIGKSCPYCSGNKVLVGFNDLSSQFPKIGQEAYGWDPSTFTFGSSKLKKWKCQKGHIYEAIVKDRSGTKKVGCSYCANLKVLSGFNDLFTLFPDIAKEAHGWDPKTIVAGSHKKMDWLCSKCNKVYSTPVVQRTGKDKTNCPNCAEYGYSPGKQAWFYLMGRPGEQMIGITNNLEQRVKQHEQNGWRLNDNVGPFNGRKVLDTETLFKRWIKKELGLISGTTENWNTTSLEVYSLKDLKDKSNIRTELF